MRETWQDEVTRQLDISPLRGGRTGFWLSSRVHPLQGWPGQVWLKREDEFGFLGSKWRKMQGLACAIQERNCDRVVAWGGRRSQHLLGLVQLIRELQGEARLLVKEGSPHRAAGPDLLAPLLIPQGWMETLSRSAWPQVAARAEARVQELTAAGHRVLLVPEGGAQIEALWGSLTLPWDIVRQESALGWEFTRIWVDAGTGLTAQALILGLGLLQRVPLCEVLLCAGSVESFARDLTARRLELSAALGIEISLAPYRCHFPVSARSFGATNRAVFQEVVRTAQESGVLLDPIYSAKLFMRARAAQAEWSAQDRILIVHSGGAMSLMGFGSALENLIS